MIYKLNKIEILEESKLGDYAKVAGSYAKKGSDKLKSFKEAGKSKLQSVKASPGKLKEKLKSKATDYKNEVVDNFKNGYKG